MFKGLIVLACCLVPTVAMAQSEAEKCAQIAPLMRALADESQALLTKAGGVLPSEIKNADPTPETQEAARAEAAGLLEGEPGAAFGEFGASTVQLLGPLTDYAQKTAVAAGLLEACAAH
jgi:hypothetical protein